MLLRVYLHSSWDTGSKSKELSDAHQPGRTKKLSPSWEAAIFCKEYCLVTLLGMQ